MTCARWVAVAALVGYVSIGVHLWWWDYTTMLRVGRDRSLVGVMWLAIWPIIISEAIPMVRARASAATTDPDDPDDPDEALTE